MKASVAPSKTITAHTMLAVGAKVKVKQQLGHVVSAVEVPAVPCGTVVVHKIEFTHKLVTQMGKSKAVEIKRVTRDVNYSFIEALA